MKKQLIVAALAVILLWGCDDPLERYKSPDWLQGSLWETLEQKGDYSLFLQGVEKTGFKRNLAGKGLYTVFAPNDEAFSKFLNDNNYSSIDEVPIDELKIVVIGHILRTAISETDLVNLNNAGAGNEGKETQGFNTHRTMASKTPGIESWNNAEYGIYYGEKQLSVFGQLKFDLLNIVDSKAAYEYLWPGTEYNNQSYYAQNAELIEGPIATENGYIYTTEEIIQPLHRTNEVLEQRGYTDVVDVYTRLSKPVYDRYYTSGFAGTIGVDSVFVIEPKSGVEAIFHDYATHDYDTWPAKPAKSTLFVPSNISLSNFLTDYGYTQRYATVNDLPVLAAKNLALSWLKAGYTFPEEILEGSSRNKVGDPILLNPSKEGGDVEFTYMSSGHLIYGLNRAITPYALAGVNGACYLDGDIKNMSAFIEYAKKLTYLSSDETEYTLFLPTNEALEKTNLYYNDWTETEETALPAVYLKDVIPAESAVVSEVGEFIDKHIVIGRFENTGDPVVLNTLKAYHVVELNNTTVENGDDISPADVPTIIGEPFNMINGLSYKINNAIQEPGISDWQSAMQINFSKFYGLIQAEGMVSEITALIDGGLPLSIFSPTNNAIEAYQTAGNLPMAGTQEMKDFINYHIVSLVYNGSTNYYLPAYEYSDIKVFTLLRESGSSEYKQIILKGNESTLTIYDQDKTESASVVNSNIHVVTGSVILGLDDVIDFRN